MYKLYLLIFIAFLIVGFIAKVLMKRRMRRALGRTVGDHELSSLNSWMAVTDKEDRDKAERP